MTTELEWRRRWTPDLAAQPWKPLRVSGRDFLVKARIGEDCYELLVSDTARLWYEELDIEGVKSRTKKLNPSIEAPIGKLLDHVRDSLESADKDATTLTVSFKTLAPADDDDDTTDADQKLLLTLTDKLAGLPFVWKFAAYPADSDMVSSHLTVPLLVMVGELSRRQRELHRLLKAKDKEIDDLKSQGQKVSRKHLETPVFDEVIFKHNMSTSKGFSDQVQGECTRAFDSEGQELYRDVMTKYSYNHRPEGSDDDLPSTFSGVDADPSLPSWSHRLPPSVVPAGSSTASPRRTPTHSPAKSPGKASRDGSPTKQTEAEKERLRQEQEERLRQEQEELRRQELDARLQQEELRKEEKSKKKKKIKF